MFGVCYTEIQNVIIVIINGYFKRCFFEVSQVIGYWSKVLSICKNAKKFIGIFTAFICLEKMVQYWIHIVTYCPQIIHQIKYLNRKSVLLIKYEFHDRVFHWELLWNFRLHAE